MSPITASVVGAGRGGLLNLRALAASPRFRLVAACDLRAEARAAAETEFPGICTYADHREMLRAIPADVVCVATLPPTHEAVATDALRTDLRGIVVEKPLGHTVDSARRLMAAIRARGLPVAVPHGLLVKRAPQEVAARVRAGEIGGLKLVEIQCRGWDIINAGIHWLNFFAHLTEGDPVAHVLAACDAGTRTYRDGIQVETLAVTSAQTRGGVRVVMHTGDETTVNDAGRATLFRLVGTLGMIEFWGWPNEYRVVSPAHPEGLHVSCGDHPGTMHQRHLEGLADQIEGGDPDYAVADSSLAALEVCEAAYLSNRLRRVVTLPLEVPPAPDGGDWTPGKPYSGQVGGRDGRQFG